jgi:hypothetical protein
MPQGAGKFAHQGHHDLQLVAPALGLYLFLVPTVENPIVVDQTQGREIKIAPSRPGAPLGDLDLSFMLTAAPLLEVQPERLAVTAAIAYPVGPDPRRLNRRARLTQPTWLIVAHPIVQEPLSRQQTVRDTLRG